LFVFVFARWLFYILGGWGYSVAFFIPMILSLYYLIKNDPELLKRRLRLEEKVEKQKNIVRKRVTV
jgi:hypothetical protein